MNKVILTIMFLSCIGGLSAQIDRQLPDKICDIPRTVSDTRFVDTIEQAFKRVVLEKPDSVLLIYEYIRDVNRALLVWKMNGVASCRIYYQFINYSGHEIANESPSSPALCDVNIHEMYALMIDSLVRKEDPMLSAIILNPLYCRFYIGNKTSLYAGINLLVFGRMPRLFADALNSEYMRIEEREESKKAN